MDAKELIEEIQAEKKIAIKEGILREEKPLEPIADRDIPRRLPEGWEWCRLGDYAMKVTDYVASGSFASLKENVLITNDENYAVMVKTADFSNGFSKNLTYTDEHGYKFLENSNLYGGELILSNIGSIGKVFIVPDLKRPMTLASNTVMVRMTHNEYNKYMYYMFKSPFGQGLLMSISSGTSMLKFNKTQLKSTIIPIAPLKEQYRICDVLDKVQGVIDKRERELVDLDNLIKARFVEMSNKWNASELPLSDFLDDITYGFTNPMPDSNVGPWKITAKDVVNGHVNFETARKTTQEAYDLLTAKSKPTIGDVLLTKDGTLGRTAIVEDENLCVNQSVAVLRCNNKVLPRFLTLLLQLPEYQAEMTKNSGGGTIKHIYITKVDKMLVKIPDIVAQKEYISFVKQVDKSKFINSHKTSIMCYN